MLPLFYYSLFTDAEGINPSGHVSVVGVFVRVRIYSNSIALGIGLPY